VEFWNAAGTAETSGMAKEVEAEGGGAENRLGFYKRKGDVAVFRRVSSAAS